MKKQSVRVPSLDPAALNRDLLAGFTGKGQGVYGFAYREIDAFITSFRMGHNPLKTLRRILPQWQWKVTEVESSAETEGGMAGWCQVARDVVVCTWIYNPCATTNTVFMITATRPREGIGFACRMAGGNGHQPTWVLVNSHETVRVDGNFNTQACPGCREPNRFLHFGGLLPDGTVPVLVEAIAEIPWRQGGKTGYITHYRMPDGSTATRSITTDEW